MTTNSKQRQTNGRTRRGDIKVFNTKSRKLKILFLLNVNKIFFVPTNNIVQSIIKVSQYFTYNNKIISYVIVILLLMR